MDRKGLRLGSSNIKGYLGYGIGKKHAESLVSQLPHRNPFGFIELLPQLGEAKRHPSTKERIGVPHRRQADADHFSIETGTLAWPTAIHYHR